MRDNHTNISDKQLSLSLVASVALDVLKRWRMVVATTLIAAMVAFVVVDMNHSPVYQTTTTFVATSANTNSTTYSNLSAATNAASLFTEVLNSSILRQVVLKEAGITSFDGNIAAQVSGDTNILLMTVRGSDPRTVFQVSQAIIHHHHEVSASVMTNTVLEVLKEPTVPTSPINTPNYRSIVLRVSMITAAGVAMLMAVLSFMSDKVRSKEEADAKLNCNILGELYHEGKYKTLQSWIKRKKKSILITSPLTSFIYSEAVNRLASRVDKRRRKGERVIMVTSFLENEGKSTVAVNLALALAKKGRKALLIDCDLRKPACTKILGSTKQTAGILDILQGRATMTDCLRHLKTTGLDVLPSGKSLRMTTNLVSSAAMEDLLKEAAEAYEIVIVDTPPMALAPDAECISEFAHGAVFVACQNMAMANDLNGAITILNNNTHLLGCVLNNVHGARDFSPVFHSGDYGKYRKYGQYGHYGYGRRE